MNKISDLPCGDSPAPLKFPHFPTRHQAVIWRNWNLVAPSVLAKILHTTPRKIVAAANAMGLKRDDSTLALWKERGYQTIIRRNWELLNYEQLLQLLEWQPEQLDFVLKEEDFFFYKLGLHKPNCEEVKYRELSAEESAKTKQIKKIVEKITAQLPSKIEKPFDFLKNYGKMRPIPKKSADNNFEFNFIYSYSALYGDTLLDDDLKSFPDGLLADYAANGINGIWLQGILYQLVPWLGADLQQSNDWQRRISNLKKLIEKAGKYGIKIYLYMNEPRSMSKSFFERHPDWRGVAGDSNDYALCTSVPEVLTALSRGIENLARQVPELGGIFSITMSENLTHCRSRWKTCPRCEKHSAAELIANVNLAIARGIKNSGAPIKLIAFDWAWRDEWFAEIVKRIGNIPIMSVSEKKLPTDFQGYQGVVNDYSISKVGPSPSTQKNWAIAQKNGNNIVAKIQVNSSWELSAVPYIPVPNLVEEHLRKLRKQGVNGLMLSWTLGGAPGGNLPLLYCSLEDMAKFRFGDAKNQVLMAWKKFSGAFKKYFIRNGFSIIYFAPQNFGPSNLLYEKPTGRNATMIGFPYDDMDTWRGKIDNPAATHLINPIPQDLLLNSFQKLAKKWRDGIKILDHIDVKMSKRERNNLDELITIAKACCCHWDATVNEIEFVMARDQKIDYASILRKERKTAIELLKLLSADSRIGFEASNHYFYVSNDLLEKVINCDFLLKSTAK